MDQTLLQQTAHEARGLALDAIHRCSSGHLGLPLGCAELGAVLFGHFLQFDPAQPRWLNRDRFVLSAGHGSMFLYGWLHLAGYDLTTEDLKNFRQLHSRTPGHPEFGETPGVECTTGPLGQGVGNAVGLAISGQMLAARFNPPGDSLFDYRVVCLAGDGCLQEGVARESAALAGHLGLDNLILIYDDNKVTLDAQADQTQSEDVAALYTALGWHVQTIDGHDLAAITQALATARATRGGQPHLIIARTEIGRGIPEVAGTWKAHGEGGAKFTEAARARLGLPAAEHFFVSSQTRAFFADRAARSTQARADWDSRYAAWKAAHPDLAAILEDGYAARRPDPASLLALIPPADPTKTVATRVSGGLALNALAPALPLLTGGSADLYGSTKNYLEKLGDFSRSNRLGRNFRFGIREHAMGAIVNGLGYEGLFLASGATFFTFSDYMRPSVRLSALARLPVLWYWTHDSIGVGEDGPTHQPVEHLAACRAIPNLDLIRPADPEETAAAVVAALTRTDGPTALVLSRQNLPVLASIPVETRRQGVFRGGYVARPETGPLDTILLSCGSELHLALAAAEKLGPGTRVVSLPSMFRFNAQPAAYRDEVLPPSCRRRLALEAGVGVSWYPYTGLDGRVLSLETFGLSAPAPAAIQELGLTPDAILAAARALP